MLKPMPPDDLSREQLLKWGRDNLSGIDLLAFLNENGFRTQPKPDTRSRAPVPEWVKKLPPDERRQWALDNNHI